VRFLCLGGDEHAPVHEKGVQIIGGWIEGGLDLEACHLPNDITIQNSVIDGDLTLMDASCEGIYLTGSRIKALNGDRVMTKGSIHFQNSFQASGEVRLVGAQIGGNLVCNGGRFENAGGNALNFDRAGITGSVFLRDGFHVSGTVRLLGAQIGGNLSCSGGRFQNADGKALLCDNAVVTGGFFFRKVAGFEGVASLPNLSVGVLVDDSASWAMGHEHILDGFRYGMVTGGSPTDAASRIAWLDNQRKDHTTTDFRPQPWKHLIRTLRKMGHSAEADEVAIAFQDRRRRAGKVSGLAAPLHWMFGKIAGYGYKPMRLLGLMASVWIGCGLIYQNAAETGWIAPTNPHLFQDARYAPCRPENGSNWVTCDEKTPPEYTSFNALAYSLDLILPLVELQQDKDWAPIIGKSAGAEGQWTLGSVTRLVMWFEILFGWLSSLLLVAVLTGLTNREGKDEG
jgi:hypothetical protein